MEVICLRPMGVFEMASFESGTRELMNTVAEATKNGAITIIGML